MSLYFLKVIKRILIAKYQYPHSIESLSIYDLTMITLMYSNIHMLFIFTIFRC
jgi:hypothetical protein